MVATVCISLNQGWGITSSSDFFVPFCAAYPSVLISVHILVALSLMYENKEITFVLKQKDGGERKCASDAGFL